MAKKPSSFEELVLQERGKEREQFGKALAAERGAAPFSKTTNEDEQDRLWMFVAPAFRGPQGDQMLIQLVKPAEQGGGGLTPLAASLEKYPHRRLLYEGAGESIEDHIAYATHREERIAEKQAATTEQPPEAPVEPQAPGIPPAEGY